MSIKITTEEFIEKARAIHGDRYDYSLVEYVNALTKVKIICKIHGIFEQKCVIHHVGSGCLICAKTNKTTEEFIEKAKLKHGDRYDYSLVNYVDTKTNIDVICKVHGIYSQTSRSHLKNGGCPKCGKYSKTTDYYVDELKVKYGNQYDFSLVVYKGIKSKVKIICHKHGIFEKNPNDLLSGSACKKCYYESISLNRELFIEKAQAIHGNRYDYSKVEYHNNSTNITIICPDHGEYLQKPASHLNNKHCPKCKPNHKMNTNDFIIKAKKIHGDEYDYSLTNYSGSHNNLEIICKLHGSYFQSSTTHLCGGGCPVCRYIKSGQSRRLSQEEFIERSKKIHNNKYDYSLVNYLGCEIDVEIICNTHGIFKQKPTHHLTNRGCQSCNESKGEKLINLYLEKNNIIFVRQKMFSDCKKVRSLEFDFYIENKNLLIEFNGKQHYQPIEYFGGEKMFKTQQERDHIKFEYAKNNNIKLLLIKYTQIKNIENILDNYIK